MSFIVKSLRTNVEREMTSEQLKNQIIRKTESRYDRAAVAIERTGLRPTVMKAVLNSLNDNIYVLKNVFIVSALFRYNNNPQTRYLILVDGLLEEAEEKLLLEIVNEYVPIWCVSTNRDATDTDAQYGYLSEWFRSTMGNGFSFIDIDYLIYNEDTNSILLLEEKATYTYRIGYGQLLSYEEMLRDVIRINANLMFLYVVDNEYKYFVCNRNMLANQNRKHYFNVLERGFSIHRNYIEEFDGINDLIDFINNMR